MFRYQYQDNPINSRQIPIGFYFLLLMVFYSHLGQIEAQLVESDLYLAKNKEKLTALLNEQVSNKKHLEMLEMDWLALQEELEGLLE
ncbi:hypothetical protein AB6W72_08595 [Pasteurella multocida]|uniref:hypothetical protein n=2 Tax=Pasteurella multocida TaxID=747 RepID=UPI001AD83989|nr:hypothetical protein [Pasteurella multocida]MDX3887927.1 hypothetical protein [Pasteurella multocida]MDX3957902.1 hypothetical protein [Pasteurella multocida]MDX3964182.1 hypothetical protein [Pasteurella multocida]